MDDYKKYIKEIKKIADPKSVALWELEIFNRRDWFLSPTLVGFFVCGIMGRFEWRDYYEKTMG